MQAYVFTSLLSDTVVYIKTSDMFKKARNLPLWSIVITALDTSSVVGAVYRNTEKKLLCRWKEVKPNVTILFKLEPPEETVDSSEGVGCTFASQFLDALWPHITASISKSSINMHHAALKYEIKVKIHSLCYILSASPSTENLWSSSLFCTATAQRKYHVHFHHDHPTEAQTHHRIYCGYTHRESSIKRTFTTQDDEEKWSLQ